jgi:hypothetical protein
MKKYDKIRYVDMYPEIRGKKVQVTVKYDGSNGRLTFADGHFWFGTRNTETKDTKDLPHGLGACFKELAAKVRTSPDFKELSELLDGNVLFYEVCGRRNKHKLLYDWDIDYIAFDLWVDDEDRYVGFDDPRLARIIEIFGMTKAEVLEFDNYDDAWAWLQVQDGRKIEGVVVKDYATGMRCKALHPENPEIESSIFAKHRGTPNYWESKFIHKYLTWKRVEKKYHEAIIEDGVKGMQVMGFVLKRLYQDLIIECLPAFIIQEKPEGINIKYIRKHFPEIARPMIIKMVQDDGNTR